MIKPVPWQCRYWSWHTNSPKQFRTTGFDKLFTIRWEKIRLFNPRVAMSCIQFKPHCYFRKNVFKLFSNTEKWPVTDERNLINFLSPSNTGTHWVYMNHSAGALYNSAVNNFSTPFIPFITCKIITIIHICEYALYYKKIKCVVNCLIEPLQG